MLKLKMWMCSNFWITLLIFFIFSQKGQVLGSNSSTATDTEELLEKDGRISLSLHDPNSFSNPQDIRVDHYDIRWTIDFNRSVIFGSVNYRLTRISSNATELKMDIRDLEIKSITQKNDSSLKLKFNIGERFLNFGQPLIIELPKEGSNYSDDSRCPFCIKIEYETKPNSTALQWLPKEQTNDKVLPYLFSQCESFNARSLIPSQDTPFVKSTYTAEVFATEEFTVLMSAIRNEEEPSDNISTTTNTAELNNHRLHKFTQKIPIPSYLIAIAVGKLNNMKIGPRTTIWAEEALLKKAAFDFSQTEEFIQIAENLVGEYVWGIYDILVLPSSFPYGGMENPCLTFVTPTLLAGDKSLAFVVAHEIAHSWTGNLVTTKNWEHFWLNEGFTTFLERKILGRIHGEPFRQLESIGGYKGLKETIALFGSDNPITNLVVDMRNVDPDGAFSRIPYEKGYLFLYFLEQKVGGHDIFETFLKEYIQEHKFKSIDSNIFKTFFINYFTKLGKSDDIKDVDWDSWFFKHGMPSFIPKYDTSLADACTALKDRWFKWNPSTEPNPFNSSDLDNLEIKSPQIMNFLDQILDSNETLGLEKVKSMQDVYNFNTSKNYEILFRWLRISIQAKWTNQIPLALKFVTVQNRMSYIRPIYRDLFQNEDFREEAINTFKKNRKFMMHVSAESVAKDLGLP